MFHPHPWNIFSKSIILDNSYFLSLFKCIIPQSSGFLCSYWEERHQFNHNSFMCNPFFILTAFKISSFSWILFLPYLLYIDWIYLYYIWYTVCFPYMRIIIFNQFQMIISFYMFVLLNIMYFSLCFFSHFLLEFRLCPY